MNNKKTVIIIFLCFFVLFILNILVSSIYYSKSFGQDYSKKVTIIEIINGIKTLETSNIKEAFTLMDIAFLISYIISFLVFIILSKQKYNLFRVILFLLQTVILLPGWLGILMLVESFSGIDGEWIAEDSTKFILLGLWNLFLIILAIKSIKVKTES